MNRKLIGLNAVLLLVLVYGGVQLWHQHQAAKARAAALQAVHIQPIPAGPFMALPNDPPVLALGYKDVAMKNLFHPTRNPDIPKDPPPVPPPPPPMPELPRYYGQMNIGDGPMALLTEKAGGEQKAVKPGETIGQFKLVDVNTSEITFAWTFNGELARRPLSALMDHAAAGGLPPAPANAAGAPAPAPAAPVIATKLGPGAITGFGFKECQANDSSPEGTVDGGFRKTLVSTGPFGKSCRWDPVK